MPGGTHLTGVEPVLQPRFVPDAWQHQPVHHVLTNGGQDGQTKSNAQQHEESREVFDAHLQRLWQNRKGKVMNGGAAPGPMPVHSEMNIVFCWTQGKLETVSLCALQMSLYYTVKGIQDRGLLQGTIPGGATHI